MLRYLCSLNYLLLNLTQPYLLQPNGNAHNQYTYRRYYLHQLHILPKYEYVTKHRINDIHKADKWYETCITALEGNGLAHDTDCIECSRTEQNQVVKRTEFQKVQRSVCHYTSYSKVCGCRENAKEAVVEENDGVGDLFQWSIEHSDRGAHETG